MPVILPESAEARALKGLHLFHSPFSNCSQRTRLVLAEKGIDYESHVINLMAFEHLTPFYQGIHPKGVVPALVHDGRAVVESHDIIRYLDDHFPGPALMPGTETERQRVAPWMSLGEALQTAIKTLTYERIFRPKYPPTPERYAVYAAQQRNPDLVAFYRSYLDGFDAGELAHHERTICDFLDRVDAALAEAPWLAGNSITLADFSAVVNVHRAGKLGIPLEGRPRLTDWYARMESRPSFQAAIVAFAA